MKVRDLARTLLRHADLSEAANAKSKGELIAMIKSGKSGKGMNLEYTVLIHANLKGVNLEDANLEGSVIQAANLFGANLRGANLRNTDLRDAYLENANLQGANLSGSKLQGADLTGVKYDSDTVWPRGFNPPPSR